MNLYFLTSNGGCAEYISKICSVKKHTHIFLAGNKEKIKKKVSEFETYFSCVATICNFGLNSLEKTYKDILESKVVVVHGGDYMILLKNFKRFNLEYYLKQVPIYVGISAGAIILTKFFDEIQDDQEYFQTEQNIECLGWVNDLKIDCHFNLLKSNLVYIRNVKKSKDSTLFLTDGSYIMINNNPNKPSKTYHGIIYMYAKGRWYIHTDRFRKLLTF